MSTVSTHLNWGASYMVDDYYKRFVAPDRDDGHYVSVARVCTVILVVFASMVALWLENALQAFQILLQIGAGTGLIFLLRWYWWRINAWGEIAAMVISFSVAVYFEFVHGAMGFAAMSASAKLVTGVVVTTAGWVLVTLMTPPTDDATLQSFYRKIRPLGPGWGPVAATTKVEREAGDESLTAAFLAWFLGCIAVYAALFGVGYVLYGSLALGSACLAVAAVGAWRLARLLPRMGFKG
jgi:Na+/proline symporter